MCGKSSSTCIYVCLHFYHQVDIRTNDEYGIIGLDIVFAQIIRLENKQRECFVLFYKCNETSF